MHKATPNVSAEQRCDMIELAIKHQPKFVLNKIEINKGGPSYTVETLEILKQQHLDDSLVLMMGTDAFAKFHSWHRWQDIIKLANIVIMHRPGEPVPMECTSGQIYSKHQVNAFTQPAGQMLDLEVTQLDISSTKIRNQIANGQGAEYLLLPCVMEYIKEQALYQPEK